MSITRRFRVSALGLLVISSFGLGCAAQVKGFGAHLEARGPERHRGRSAPPPTARGVAPSGAFESEDALTRRFCSLLEERLADQERQLGAIKSEKDPRKAVALHGRVYRDALVVQRTVQREFDAEYRRIAQAAFKSGRAGTYGVGYLALDNGNHFQRSEAALAALAGGTEIMAKSGIPFASSDDNGIRASEVNFGTSECRSKRRAELTSQIAANVKQLERPFEVSEWVRDAAMPVTRGQLVTVRGDLLTGGASPALRLSASTSIYKNCRETNRLDRIDDRGVIHYQEECEHAGARTVVVLITVKNAASLLPNEVTRLEPVDYVALTGRLVSATLDRTKKGDVTTFTHTVEIEPILVRELVRGQKALVTF